MQCNIGRTWAAWVACALAISASRAAADDAGMAVDPPFDAARSEAPRVLSPDEIARRAVATSFRVRAREADAESAHALSMRARSAYVPRLTTASRYTRLSPVTNATDDPSYLLLAPTAGAGLVPDDAPLVNVPFSFPMLRDRWALEVSASVPLSDYVLRTPHAVAASEHEQHEKTQTTEATRAQVTLDALIAYHGWRRAAAANQVADEALAQAEQHLRDAQRGNELGTVTVADVRRAESRVAEAELAKTRAHHGYLLAEEELRTLMHDTSSSPLAVTTELGALEPERAATSPEALLDAARAQRAELKAFDHAIAAAHEQAEVERATALPRLELTAVGRYENPSSRMLPQTDAFAFTWEAGVALTWSPTDVASALFAERAAKARAARLEAERHALEDSVRREVLSAHYAWLEADASRETAARGLLAAEESHRVRKALFDHGAATSTELTDAEVDLTRAKLAVIDAELDAQVARARLAHAMGELE